MKYKSTLLYFFRTKLYLEMILNSYTVVVGLMNHAKTDTLGQSAAQVCSLHTKQQLPPILPVTKVLQSVKQKTIVASVVDSFLNTFLMATKIPVARVITNFVLTRPYLYRVL